jgi:hypothetical protein
MRDSRNEDIIQERIRRTTKVSNSARICKIDGSQPSKALLCQSLQEISGIVRRENTDRLLYRAIENKKKSRGP